MGIPQLGWTEGMGDVNACRFKKGRPGRREASVCYEEGIDEKARGCHKEEYRPGGDFGLERQIWVPINE